jgi:hypothetical protein
MGSVTTEELTTSDAPRWREVLPIDRSVFGSIEFAGVQEAHRGADVRLFVVTSDTTTVAQPYFVRPIADLPFAGDETAALCDAATPEYTGPLAKPGGAGDIDFARRFSAHCSRSGIVAEFAHLHPWHADSRSLPAGDVRPDREIVYVDLTLEEEEIWRQSFRASCRKNVKRAINEGVQVRHAADDADIAEFHRIYTMTMDRVGAAQQYRFGLPYFRSVRRAMPENADVLLAVQGRRVIAALLVLHDEIDMYSYLGGADLEFGQLRPSNLLHYEAIRSGHARRKRRYVLGGGHRPDDGVFRFKADFSPLRQTFSVVRRIHLPEAYDELCRRWTAFHGRRLPDDGYFPAYRRAPDGGGGNEDE